MGEYAGAEKDAYVGRYLREFDKQFAGFPSIDLRSAIQTADAHWEHSPDRSEPEEDAREEFDCWREAS